MLLVVLSLLAFAGNSLLCRLALAQTGIDAASFTTIRLVSGALVLAVIVALKPGARVAGGGNGDWGSAFALFAYAAAFSFAYIGLGAATGALLLFGVVQAAMIGWGLRSGERLAARQWVGVGAAVAGLVVLLMPGLSAPPLLDAGLMAIAGFAWAAYSIRGRGAVDPVRVTAGNFLRAVPFAVVLGVACIGMARIDAMGVVYAIASGAITSGLGYVLWYAVLPSLKATSAATVQLSVPVIAAVGGVVLLGEGADLRLVFASVAVLGGIALVILGKRAA